MKSSHTIMPAICGCLLFLTGGCHQGTLTRPAGNGGNLLQVETKYITGSNIDDYKKDYSVSYVEFDALGTFLQHEQGAATLDHLEERFKAAKKKGRKFLVLSYTHGWRNGPATQDALEFRRFVKRMARSLRNQNFDVAGVYLSWPGEPYGDWPALKNSNQYEMRQAGIDFLPEVTSYMNRKTVAENAARKGSDYTMFLDGLSSRFGSEKQKGSFHVTFGHSLGAYMVESNLLTRYALSQGTPDFPLPDLVFMVNSAAPRKITDKAINAQKNEPHKRKVRFVSITSSADTTTRLWAGLGNFLSSLAPCTQETREKFEQSRVPGHSDDLLTTELVPVIEVSGGHLGNKDDSQSDFFIQMNIFPDYDGGRKIRIPFRSELAAFEKQRNLKGELGKQDPSKESSQGSSKETAGTRPYYLWRVQNIEKMSPWLDGSYAILRVSDKFILGHGDMWSGQPVSVFCYYLRDLLNDTGDLPERPVDPVSGRALTEAALEDQR